MSARASPSLKLGQRIVACIGGNGCRELIVTKAENAVPIPDGVSDDRAAALPVTFGTALHGLKDRGRLQPGETVAVLGAAGGAGLAAVEIAKLMGARVIAVASSEEKLALARKLGADEGIDYTVEDLKLSLKALTARRGSMSSTIPSAATMPRRPCAPWRGTGAIS